MIVDGLEDGVGEEREGQRNESEVGEEAERGDDGGAEGRRSLLSGLELVVIKSLNPEISGKIIQKASDQTEQTEEAFEGGKGLTGGDLLVPSSQPELREGQNSPSWMGRPSDFGNGWGLRSMIGNEGSASSESASLRQGRGEGANPQL